MDLVILVVLIGIVVFFFKQFSSFVYFVMIADIFLRLMHGIAGLLKIAEFTGFVNKYIPVSIPGIINTYSTGIFNTLLILGYIILVSIFEFYIIRIFFKKR
ncbi:MAG: hypothetical protein HFH08_00295 [Bacilli bacterium]|nr:hypothetical protein [Bacilli bacterium]